MLPSAVPIVLRQHVEDAAVLHGTRTAQTIAPHVKLHHLRRFDDRIAAHLDGLAVAGDDALSLIKTSLETPTASSIFVAAVRAIEDKHHEQLDRLFALAQAAPEARAGLLATFGWVEPTHLSGLVSGLLASSDPMRRMTGLAASAMHRVDPGLIKLRWLDDADQQVRARALRTAGELGKHELVSRVASAIKDDDPACRFWAAWSAVLLGDRQHALTALKQFALSSEPHAHQQRALQVALAAQPFTEARKCLQSFVQEPSKIRLLIQGMGLVGDVEFIPWLIDQMSNDQTARIAGEAFSLITGADLAWLDLERKPPQDFESGPNDNPEDPNVEMDADDGLPWPDIERIKRWWSANARRFPTGERCFMGSRPTREHCIDVLKNGYQRQRIVAAYHLSLLNPGNVLFEWRAPAWRQKQALALLI